MEISSYKPGTPSWVDIGVPDMDAAVAFYGGLFGWTFTEGVEEAGGYRQAQGFSHALRFIIFCVWQVKLHSPTGVRL